MAFGASLSILTAMPAIGLEAAARSGPTDFALSANGGTVVINQPGAQTSLRLPAGLARDMSVQVSVRTNRLPVGPGQAVAIVLRRNVSGEYRARLELAPTAASCWPSDRPTVPAGA
jgi:hypothetical protein